MRFRDKALVAASMGWVEDRFRPDYLAGDYVGHAIGLHYCGITNSIGLISIGRANVIVYRICPPLSLVDTSSTHLTAFSLLPTPALHLSSAHKTTVALKKTMVSNGKVSPKCTWCAVRLN